MPFGGQWETDAARSWRAGRGNRIEDYSDELAKRWGARTQRLGRWILFFFVYSYSHSTYVDHGGVHLLSVSSLLSARWRLVASFPMPSAQAYPKMKITHQGKKQRKERKRKKSKPPQSPNPPPPAP